MLGFGGIARLATICMNKTEETERREKILFFWKKYGLDATIEAFNTKKSTLYSWKKKQTENDLTPKSRRPKQVRVPTTPSTVIDAVCELRTALPYLGKEKISVVLKRRGIIISPSTVGRIIKREHLPRAPRLYVAKKKKAVRRLRKPKDYEAKSPGELVGMDTITVQDKGKKRYLITAIDYYTRIAISLVYTSPNSSNAKDLLLRMQIALGVPIKAVNTDNGSEFLKHYHKTCQELGILHFFTHPRTPKMNPLAERFNRSLQEEAELPFVENSLNTWNKYVAHYIMQYNFFRPHESLNQLTPVEKFLNSKKSNMLWTHTNH